MVVELKYCERRLLGFSVKVHPSILRKKGFWETTFPIRDSLRQDSEYILTADDLAWPELRDINPDEFNVVLKELYKFKSKECMEVELVSVSYEPWLNCIPDQWIEKGMPIFKDTALLAAYTSALCDDDFDCIPQIEKRLSDSGWKSIGFDVVNIHLDSVLAVFPYSKSIRNKFKEYAGNVNIYGLFSTESIASEWAVIANRNILPEHGPYYVLQGWVEPSCSLKLSKTNPK